MTEDTQSNDSTDTVMLIPTGIASNPKYILNKTLYCKRILNEVKTMQWSTDATIDTIIVRGNSQIADLLDKATDVYNVDSYSIDFRGMLDDESVSYETENGEETIRGVIGDGSPVSEHVTEVHGIPPTDFSLTNYSEQDEYVGYNVLSAIEDEDDRIENGNRIGRARSKAMGRATERLLNDWYDKIPTAEHALVIDDGTDSHRDALNEVRAGSDWVKHPTACEGIIRHIQMNGNSKGCLDWTRRYAEKGNELTDNQVANLRARLSPDELEALGIEATATNQQSTPTTPSIAPSDD